MSRSILDEEIEILANRPLLQVVKLLMSNNFMTQRDYWEKGNRRELNYHHGSSFLSCVECVPDLSFPSSSFFTKLTHHDDDL